MLDFFGAIGSAIMTPLYFITSAVLSGFHSVFGNVLGPDSGAAWALSIIGLTMVIRAALIPLFVKQIKSSRNMQLIQPKVRELQKKYGHDREKLAQETMALYREAGTNPFASCLPILLQMPIFLALFRMLDRAAHGETRGLLTDKQVDSLANATLFGAKISETFIGIDGAPETSVRVLAAVLVIAMTATTFLTQRQLMTKNMPADALTGQYAQQQKILLYVLPVVFAVGGIAFPIGVLLYWTTSNLWTMGQQFYVIRRNPAPGTPAAEAKARRDADKRARKGLPAIETETGVGPTTGDVLTEERPQPARQQPKKQTREQRRKQAAPRPVGTTRSTPGKAAAPKSAQGKGGSTKATPKGKQSGKRRPRP